MEEENKKNIEEHMYPEGGYGWFIVFANILLNASLLTLTTCFGIIFGNDITSMGIDATKTSFLLHLQNSLYCVIGFFGSPLLKKYEFRTVALVGSTIWCTGILLTSFADSYLTLLLTVSLLTGVGQGILMPSTYLAMNTYFKKRLTLAVSISATGAMLFSVVSPKLCDFLVTTVGRKYTVLILFCISLMSFVGCFLLKPLKKKVEAGMEELTKFDPAQTSINGYTNQVYQETTKPVKRETALTKLIAAFDLNLLKRIPYIVSVVCLGISFAAEINIVFTMQFVLPELSNFTSTEVANVTTIQFVFDILGRLLIPMMCHYFNATPKWVYASALVAASASRILLATYTHYYAAVYIACCVIGATKGVRAVYQSVIIPKLVPLEKFVAANGFQMFFTGSISLMIGPVIGAIHDAFNSYVPALHASSVLSCACVFVWVLEAFLSRTKTTASPITE